MSYNKSYQHVERVGKDEVEGILHGTCYVMPKLDGTNGVVWYDGDTIHCGSRNREVSVNNDNQGFMNYIIKDQRFWDFFKRHPDLTLYGEWLKPHAIKHYENDAWDKFYVFDVMRGDTYLRFEDYKNILDNFQIDYVPVMAVLNSPSEEKICELAEKATYLCKPDTIGEGVVVHNYDFYNKYGRQTWAKVVNQKFKETKKEAYGIVECVEEIIVKEFLTPEEIEKEKCKIEDFDNKKIGELMGRVYHEFVRDNMNDIIKKHKNLTIRFKVLNGCVCKAVREHLKL